MSDPVATQFFNLTTDIFESYDKTFVKSGIEQVASDCIRGLYFINQARNPTYFSWIPAPLCSLAERISDFNLLPFSFSKPLQILTFFKIFHVAGLTIKETVSTYNNYTSNPDRRIREKAFTLLMFFGKCTKIFVQSDLGPCFHESFYSRESRWPRYALISHYGLMICCKIYYTIMRGKGFFQNGDVYLNKILIEKIDNCKLSEENNVTEEDFKKLKNLQFFLSTSLTSYKFRARVKEIWSIADDIKEDNRGISIEQKISGAYTTILDLCKNIQDITDGLVSRLIKVEDGEESLKNQIQKIEISINKLKDSANSCLFNTDSEDLILELLERFTNLTGVLNDINKENYTRLSTGKDIKDCLPNLKTIYDKLSKIETDLQLLNPNKTQLTRLKGTKQAVNRALNTGSAESANTDSSNIGRGNQELVFRELSFRQIDIKKKKEELNLSLNALKEDLDIDFFSNWDLVMPFLVFQLSVATTPVGRLFPKNLKEFIGKWELIERANLNMVLKFFHRFLKFFNKCVI